MSHKYYKTVYKKYQAMYDFKPSDSIFGLAKRMDKPHWEEFKTALKYPNGIVQAVPDYPEDPEKCLCGDDLDKCVDAYVHTTSGC